MSHSREIRNGLHFKAFVLNLRSISERLTLFLTGSGITLPDGGGHFVPTILEWVLITIKLSKLAFKSILGSLAFHRHPKQPSM